MDHIRDNWELLRARIERAAGHSGRTASSIEVVAVSKTRSAREIEAAYACGLRLVGENRIQEAAAKRPAGRRAPRLALCRPLADE